MQRNTEFTIRDVFFLLKKRLVLICTVTILAVLLSYIYSMCLVQPVFECNTTLIVSVEQSGASKTTAQIADTLGYILKNQSLLQKVTQILNLHQSADTLSDNLDFAETETTGIYLLTVKAGSESLAGAITDTVIKYVPDEISSSLKIGSIEIITLSEDTKQISPNVLNNVFLGFFIGFALSCALSFVMELMNNKFKTNDDVKTRLAYPVIGVIPSFPPSDAHFNPGGGTQLIESFNALQAVLRHKLRNKTVKKIIIVSPLTGDGKTTVAMNLAAAMRSNDRKILVVDADFRTPGISGVLFPDASGQEGLSAVLANNADLSGCVRDVQGTFVLPSGSTPDNPNALLQSDAMRTFLEEAESRYDTLLFDTPPVAKHSDAVTLLPKMDGAIFVVRHNHTTFEAAAFAKERLEMVNAYVIGCIINAFDTRGTNKIYTYDLPASHKHLEPVRALTAVFDSVINFIKSMKPRKP